MDIYNTVTTARTTAKLSQPRSGVAAVSAGSKAFFAGGTASDNGERSDVVDIYDSSTTTWTVAKLSAARNELVATAAGNLVFFAGGSESYS